MRKSTAWDIRWEVTVALNGVFWIPCQEATLWEFSRLDVGGAGCTWEGVGGRGRGWLHVGG